MYQTLLSAVVWLALVRCGWLLIGLIRLIPVHRRAKTRKWGPTEFFTTAELPLFFALTLYFFSRAPASSSPSLLTWLAAIVGVLLALTGVVISLWSVYTTYRAGIILDAGHYIKKEHRLITTGAYGFVRNPMYLGVFLIWLGIATGFKSLTVLLITVFYVIPVYLVYIRSKEPMLLREFGDEYESYRDRVGMILPRLNRSS